MIEIPELDIKVEDIGDFNYEAGEILEQYCEELQADGMTYPVPGEDKEWAEEAGIAFYWKDTATKLINAKLDELYAIGVKYFDEERKLELYITTRMYIEP